MVANPKSLNIVKCNQGCGTHVYFKNGEPYNYSDNKPHKKTCMSLKIGKWWGGKENTIPIRRIKDSISKCTKLVPPRKTHFSFKEMDEIVKTVQSEMEYLMRQIRDQEKWNAEQARDFEAYKKRLVAEQSLREERKRIAISSSM